MSKWNGLHFEGAGHVMSGFYVVNLSGVDMVHYKGGVCVLVSGFSICAFKCSTSLGLFNEAC